MTGLFKICLAKLNQPTRKCWQTHSFDNSTFWSIVFRRRKFNTKEKYQNTCLLRWSDNWGVFALRKLILALNCDHWIFQKLHNWPVCKRYLKSAVTRLRSQILGENIRFSCDVIDVTGISKFVSSNMAATPESLRFVCKDSPWISSI